MPPFKGDTEQGPLGVQKGPYLLNPKKGPLPRGLNASLGFGSPKPHVSLGHRAAVKSAMELEEAGRQTSSGSLPLCPPVLWRGFLRKQATMPFFASLQVEKSLVLDI